MLQIKCESKLFIENSFQTNKMIFNFSHATPKEKKPKIINVLTIKPLNPCAVHSVNSALRWNQSHLRASIEARFILPIRPSRLRKHIFP